MAEKTDGIDKRNRTAIGGQKVKLSSAEVDRLGDYKVCVGGFASGLKLIYGEKGVGIHRVKFRRQAIWWDENGHGYEFVLDRDRANRCLYCRFCGRYQGCLRCLESTLLCEIFCSVCGEYSNEVGWWQHGNVRKDRHRGLTTMQMFRESQAKAKDNNEPRMFYRAPTADEVRANVEKYIGSKEDL